MQHFKHIYLILIFSLIFFSLLSYTNGKFNILSSAIKPVDLFSEIRADKIVTTKKRAPSQKNNSKPGAIKKRPNSFITIDSSSSTIYNFFNALDELKSKKKAKLRVAHFGDSAIESDLITSELRKQYQLKYGGSGFGFVPMASIGPATRVSSFHNFSKEWKLLNIKENNKEENPVGLSGYSALVPAGKIMQSELIIPKNSYNKGFANVRIFCGPVSGDNEQVIINDSAVWLQGSGLLNEINTSISGSSVKIKTANKHDVIMYGFSTESDTGVVMDNYSFRGSSGTLFTNFRENQLKAWDSLMRYDLIILQFGINTAGSSKTDYTWYQKKFDENLKYLQKHFPKTPIVIIGCGDRAVKKDGAWQTLSGIPNLIEVQKQIAVDNHCAFVDLFQLMGGENTMVSWVKNKPALANKDYTHYTHKGAEKVGKILFDALETEYNLYNNARFNQ